MTVKTLKKKMPLDVSRAGWENIKVGRVSVVLVGETNTIKTQKLVCLKLELFPAAIFCFNHGYLTH
jgi:hypothetical protein